MIRSIRGSVPLLPGSATGLSTPVASRIGAADLSAAQASAFDTDIDAAGMSRDERRTRDLDRRLDQMIRNPMGFAAEFAAYTAVEQEIWIAALAERARETGQAETALSELRLAGGRSALQLATAFSVELQKGVR